MNRNLKTLLSAGIVSLAMIGGKTIQSNAMSVKYVNSNLNIRQYASISSKKLGLIPKGSKINIYGEYGDWYSIKYGNTWGYVNKNYVGNSTNNNTNIVVNKGQNKGLILSRLVIVNTYYNKIYLYQNGKLIWSRSVASGKPSTPSPVGQFTIVNKIVNPYYSKGNIKGGSPSNPLGVRWLGIGGAYGLHGNNNESSIGKKISNGCIRLHNYDIVDLYNRVSVGDKVIISNKPTNNSTIANVYGYKVY